jgi:hypothetical protein
VDSGSMKGYLESIVQGNEWPSDLDVWECMCDIVETVNSLGSWVAVLRNRDLTGTAGVEGLGKNNIAYFSLMMPPL